MKDDDELNVLNKEYGEDATKYGEFVSSYFAWIAPEYQKKKAKKMQSMTEDKKEK